MYTDKKSKFIIFAGVFVFISIFFFTHTVSALGAVEGKQCVNECKGENKGTVYLTFDADMTPEMKERFEKGLVKSWYSPGIVEYLEKQQIPVTVFTTGMFAEMYPSLIKELAKNGFFSIQNHTYDHKAFESPCFHLKSVTDEKEKVKEITKTQEIIKSLTGVTPKYVRLPGLCFAKSDEDLIDTLGLISENTGIVSKDAFNKNDSKKIVRSVLTALKPGKNVVVMHLGGHNAPKTEQALRELVPEILKRGYEFEKF